MLSQILRFTLPPPMTVSDPLFLSLCQKALTAGAAEQYYGYTFPSQVSPLPRKRHEICWIIHWRGSCDRGHVMTCLNELTNDAVSLLLDFSVTQRSNLAKALEAPICEFACIRLSDTAPLSDSNLQSSMHKTYEDTFKLRGFTGGDWAYASNTNEIEGTPCMSQSTTIPASGRRLGIYLLGWESIELHEDATHTLEFAEEIRKLQPYFGPGTGAWYASFKKYYPTYAA